MQGVAHFFVWQCSWYGCMKSLAGIISAPSSHPKIRCQYLSGLCSIRWTAGINKHRDSLDTWGGLQPLPLFCDNQRCCGGPFGFHQTWGAEQLIRWYSCSVCGHCHSTFQRYCSKPWEKLLDPAWTEQLIIWYCLFVSSFARAPLALKQRSIPLVLSDPPIT